MHRARLPRGAQGPLPAGPSEGPAVRGRASPAPGPPPGGPVTGRAEGGAPSHPPGIGGIGEGGLPASHDPRSEGAGGDPLSPRAVWEGRPLPPPVPEGGQRVAAWMLEVCREQRCREEAVFPLALNYADRYMPCLSSWGEHLLLLGVTCVLLASGCKWKETEECLSPPRQLCLDTDHGWTPHPLRDCMRFVLWQQWQRKGWISSTPRACQAHALWLLPPSQQDMWHQTEMHPQTALVPLDAGEHPSAVGHPTTITAGSPTRPCLGLSTSRDLVSGQDLAASWATVIQADAVNVHTEWAPSEVSPFCEKNGSFMRRKTNKPGARPKQRAQNQRQKAVRTGCTYVCAGYKGMGQCPLTYRTLDRAQVRQWKRQGKRQWHRHRELTLALIAEGERPLAAQEAEAERVEVRGVCKSRNGRLQLVEVISTGAGGTQTSELQSQVIWESVQDGEGNFDPAKLQEAIQEVFKDLNMLRRFTRGSLRREDLLAFLNHFHYYPDEPTLQLTLEQLQVQRKMVAWGVAPRVPHQVQRPRQAAESEGEGGATPPPRGSSGASAPRRLREGLQGSPRGHSWLAALRRCCCCSSSKGEEGEEVDDVEFDPDSEEIVM